MQKVLFNIVKIAFLLVLLVLVQLHLLFQEVLILAVDAELHVFILLAIHEAGWMFHVG
jgi:hypothetical protein